MVERKLEESVNTCSVGVISVLRNNMAKIKQYEGISSVPSTTAMCCFVSLQLITTNTLLPMAPLASNT